MERGKEEENEVFTRIITSTFPSIILTLGNVANEAGERAEAASRGRCRHTVLNMNGELPESLPGLGEGLALLSAPIDELEPARSTQLIATLRNLGISHIAVSAGENSQLTFRDFLALGFRRHAVLETDNGALTLYTYNLDTYNHKRDWNNSDHWANPDMWGKAWW